MCSRDNCSLYSVNCRIGSLEKRDYQAALRVYVNCRIGSLENGMVVEDLRYAVNCRIGSLEN